MLMRETLVIHSRLSWRQVRGVAAIERQHGLQVLAIEHLAARLAGGFLQPINSNSLKEAIGEAIATDLGEFNDIKTLPGFPRAAAATLQKAWEAGLKFTELAKTSDALVCRLRTKTASGLAHQLIEQRFQEWMLAHYGTLHSLSFLPRPVMLHQIPKYMAHRLATNGAVRKLAVVVVDGLAMDQWAVVRQELPSRKWITEEFGLFAWVPTLTSVSRQSIFAGIRPSFSRRASAPPARKTALD